MKEEDNSSSSRSLYEFTMEIDADMLNDFTIRCTCGTLCGRTSDLSTDDGPRLVCYCDDCQAFARFLGRADDILDEAGGTDVFQLSPAHLRINKGIDHLACMRLKSKGLLRWFADCCRTPIGNTLATRQVSFVGLVNTCIHLEDGGSLDDLIGPVQGGVHGRFATGDRSKLRASDGAPLSLIARSMGKILKRRLRGDHRDSPFFDTRTGKPVVTPKVLSAAERRELGSSRPI